VCNCARCRVLSRAAEGWRRDPTAPTAPERWLVAHPEEWPWWLFGALLGLTGLCTLTTFGLALVVAGVVVAAVPLARLLLDACDRLPG
jgi:hypothetical protein